MPSEPFVAVGDVHGRADLLERLLEALDAGPQAEWPLIFVGDYVDRGEYSAEVLHSLHACSGDGRTVCLRGNHEEMVLDFLEDPAEHGPRWMRFGGLQTMASFGVPLVARTAPDEAWRAARDDLAEAMGADLIEWLHGLPLRWQSGNVAVVHAGADPARRIDMQHAQHLVWGHPDFETDDRADGVWVVHGHTIVDIAAAQSGRISIDTGAYATGTLSAALIAPGDVSFVTA